MAGSLTVDTLAELVGIPQTEPIETTKEEVVV